MAVARHATVRSNESVGRAARLLRLDLPPGESLGDARGGEYIIVNTGLTNELGKLLKRTYSLVHTDPAEGCFELVVHPLKEGPASNYLSGLEAGQTLTFSGPWGRKAEPHPDADVLLIGTDTGLSTLCGWTSGAGFVGWASRTRALWMRHEPDGFCSSAWARSRVEAHRVDLVVRELPSVGSDARVAVALDHLSRLFADRDGTATRPVHAVLCGDGAVLRGMKSWLLERGVGDDAIVLEPFFNKPDKAGG